METQDFGTIPNSITTPDVVEARSSRFEFVDGYPSAETASKLRDELNHLHAIRKGEPFASDSRLRAILEAAVATANAASRMCGVGARPDDRWRYYDEPTAWWNPLFEGGFEFLDPPPDIAADGSVEPYPALHTRRLNARTAMFYSATLITPAMCMRLTNIGSQYLAANLDSNGDPLHGAKMYRMVLPAGIPPACSGRRPSTTTRPGRCCAPRSATRVRAARTFPHLRRHPIPTARPPSGSVRNDPTGSPRATGCRPTRQGVVPAPPAVFAPAVVLRQDLARR